MEMGFTGSSQAGNMDAEMPSSGRISRMLCSAQGFVSHDRRERILHTFPLGIPWDWVWEWLFRDVRPMPKDSSGERP